MATRLRGGAVSPITGARFHKSFTVFFFFVFNNNFPALATIFLSQSNWQKVFFFPVCCQSTWLRPLYSNCKKKKLCRGKNIIMGSIKPLVFSLHTRSLCACITFLQDRQASRNELKSKRCLPECFAKNTKTLLARLRRRATCGGEFNKEAVREPARGHFCRAS